MNNTRSIKVAGVEYPVLSIVGKMKDLNWDGRESKAVALEMDISEAIKLFADSPAWSIVEYGTVQSVVTDENGNLVYDEAGNVAMTEETTCTAEYDNSEFCVLGDIVLHPDGTVTINLGKETDEETLLTILYGGVE